MPRDIIVSVFLLTTHFPPHVPLSESWWWWNDQLPFIHGDNLLRGDIDVIVGDSSAPYETPIAIPNEVEKTIAKYCAELVPDEA